VRNLKVQAELGLIRPGLSINLTCMGFGLGFSAGPVRVSASLRGGTAAAGEFLEALPFLVAIAVGYSVIGAIVSMVLDPYFWFIMVLGCAPAVVLLVFHAMALDKAAIGTRWSGRDGVFTLLALPAAGYEVLFFVWGEDGFNWEESIGGKWMPQLAYFAVLLGYLTLLALWISFTVRAIGPRWAKSQRRAERQAAKRERRLMIENRDLVKRHGIKNYPQLSQILDDYRIMEEHKQLVLQHGLTDASQVRAHLKKQRQLEEKRAKRAKGRQQQADAEARRRLRESEEAERLARKREDTRAVLADEMRQFGLTVQKCLNPEQGVELAEGELRAAFQSIRSSLDHYQELSPVGVAKYKKIISELSATVEDKTGYQNL
jgi:hypothetical protein